MLRIRVIKKMLRRANKKFKKQDSNIYCSQKDCLHLFQKGINCKFEFSIYVEHYCSPLEHYKGR